MATASSAQVPMSKMVKQALTIHKLLGPRAKAHGQKDHNPYG